MEEPIVRAEVYSPPEYLGAIMELCQDKRGVFKDMTYLDARRVRLEYRLPLNEIVYDFFDESMVRPAPGGEMERWCISCDYGTVNPTSLGLWGLQNGVWYRVKEYYYDSRAERAQKTDGEYADALEQLAGGRPIWKIVADPSAASFIEVLRRRGWRVEKADNDVLAGIRTTAGLLKAGKLVICEECRDAIRECYRYGWDEKAVGDRVKKVHDHAMDDIRYFAATVAAGERGYFGGLCVERGRF